ncbi:MAG: hypothetical protein HGB15_05360 [Chlorobaculum sp.]|nr:hypothetical protein [Chlorobaculum sp.]
MGKSFPGCDCQAHGVISLTIENYLSLIKSLAADFANAFQWSAVLAMMITA